MRSSSPSRRTSDAARGALVAASLALLGCAAAPPAERRVVAAAPDAAYAAAERALAASFSIASRDPAARRIETEWFEVVSRRTAGLLLEKPWRERARVAIEVEPAGEAASAVAVRVHAERKPPAGARAYRYERTEPPEGLAAEVLDAIERSADRAGEEPR